MTWRFASLAILVQIAVRNLFANRWKTLTVGGIVGFGALLVMLSTSLLDSVDRAMSRSIIGSVAGDIQVYSSESQADLDVMGGFGFDGNSLQPLADFARVRQVLSSVDNVAGVVPMGLNGGTVLSGNTADRALAKLRNSVTERARGKTDASFEEAYEEQKQHVRQIVMVLANDAKNAERVQDEHARDDNDRELLERAVAREFWSTFDQDPLQHLEFLENQIAPIASDADVLFLHYVGTDPRAFAQAFERMTIIDGQAIPEGQRGLLLSKYVYEEQLKLKTARNLDKIHEARSNRGAKIATDDELQRLVRESQTEVKELLLELDAGKTRLFRDKLQRELQSSEADVGKLLGQLLCANDQNFEHRYAFFYRELAPSLELYRVRVGDTLTVKALSRTGYVQAANLKVYGTFAFRGLERSPQAGALNMMDLVSFRDLYGFMTDERAEEIGALRRSSGARDVSRENVESALFGVPSTLTPSTANREDDLNTELAALAGTRRRDTLGYDPAQLERGMILNAAVLLKDETKTQATLTAIEAAAKRAGLPLKAVSWQKAAGLVGQFVTMMRAGLFAAMLVIFAVALVIINNALVMATLERVREIGTLRAVGAQRRFIWALLVLESVTVGLVFGGLGAALGSGVIAWLGRIGIPAGSEVLMFFFSGPRLHPTLAPQAVGLALAIVFAVSVLSSIYPAWLAMRISPREAMQAED